MIGQDLNDRPVYYLLILAKHRILSLTEPSAYPTTQQRSTRAPFQERVVVLASVALDWWLVGHFREKLLIELDFEDTKVLHR